MPTTDSTTAEPDTGQKLLDQLAADEPPITPTDPVLHSRGCITSALALHIDSGTWVRVAVYDHPDGDNSVTGTDPSDIEILAVDRNAAEQIVKALPWPHPPITRDDTDPVSGRTHVVTRGVLWGYRVAVVGLEPAEGGEQA